MLSIDEAIEKYKEITNPDTICLAHCDISCDECMQESEQLVEWLEELKVYQQHKIICNKGYNAGYNKAIDDFVRFANTMPTVEEEDGEIRPMWLEEMAEQLKEGGNDDD